jgi:hypothetical protein
MVYAQLLYAQIMTIKYRVTNDRTMTEVYMTMVSHLITARNDYFQKNKKNIFDNTIFKDFVVECIGEGIHPDREVGLKMEARRKKNKKAYYMYDPEKDVKSADTKLVVVGPGVVTDENVSKSPTSRLCAFLLIVTVVEPVVDVYVHEVKAVPSGVIS